MSCDTTPLSCEQNPLYQYIQIATGRESSIATVYMDFAGPMVASFPHQFIYYCGAIDAGSGYARLLPCHAATKEVAKQCLELLVGLGVRFFSDDGKILFENFAKSWQISKINSFFSAKFWIFLLLLCVFLKKNRATYVAMALAYHYNWYLQSRSLDVYSLNW